MYPTSNSFVFRASFSSARNRSNSIRNNDIPSSLPVLDRSGPAAAPLGVIVGSDSGWWRRIDSAWAKPAEIWFTDGKCPAKAASCAISVQFGVASAEIQYIPEKMVRRLALVNVVSRVFFDAIIQRLPDSLITC